MRFILLLILLLLVIGGLFVRETKDHRIDTPIRERAAS